MGRPTGGEGANVLRADAQRNRDRIVEAAREVFAELGIEAPLTEVARRAEVGIATLYRRFPTREELVSAAFADRMGAYAAEVDRASAEPDAWVAFCRYLESACAMQVGDQGFADVMTQTFPHARVLETERRRVLATFGTIVDRAKEAGRLRLDFVAEDLPLVLMANAGVVSVMTDAAPDAWRRVLSYLLQAFAAETAAVARPGVTSALADPPTPLQMHRALTRMQVRARRESG